MDTVIKTMDDIANSTQRIGTITTLINGLMFKVFQAAVSTHMMKHEAQKLLQPHK